MIFLYNFAAMLARYVDCIFQKSRPMQDSVVTADVRNGSLMPVWF